VLLLCNILIQTSVPDHMRGRMMGIWTLIFGAMIPLGNLEAASLASLLDAPLTLIVGALICAVATLVAMNMLRRRNAARPGPYVNEPLQSQGSPLSD
jgi:hypothetical protein